MSLFAYLEGRVRTEIGGHWAAIGQLFNDPSILDELRSMAKDSDWYHFEPKTFDGRYLLRSSGGFEVYEQDRGVKSRSRLFATLPEAASHMFNSPGP